MIATTATFVKCKFFMTFTVTGRSVICFLSVAKRRNIIKTFECKLDKFKFYGLLADSTFYVTSEIYDDENWANFLTDSWKLWHLRYFGWWQAFAIYFSRSSFEATMILSPWWNLRFPFVDGTFPYIFYNSLHFRILSSYSEQISPEFTNFNGKKISCRNFIKIQIGRVTVSARFLRFFFFCWEIIVFIFRLSASLSIGKMWMEFHW